MLFSSFICQCFLKGGKKEYQKTNQNELKLREFTWKKIQGGSNNNIMVQTWGALFRAVNVEALSNIVMAMSFDTACLLPG